MTFNEDIEKMQEIFQDTERQLAELSYIIPLDNKPDTYSPRLYSILQMACGQTENLLRILCDELNLKPDEDNFPSYFKRLNCLGMLESQQVLINKKYMSRPFAVKTKKTPDWWRGYNGTKHNLPDGMVQGNLGNTINALAGVCALHHVAYYARLGPDLLLFKDNWFNHEHTNLQNSYVADSIISTSSTSHKNKIFHCVTIFSGKYPSL